MLDILIQGPLCGVVAWRIVAIDQPKDHQHSADCPADLSHPPHAASEGRGHLCGKILAQSCYIAKGYCHRLSTVVAFDK